MSSSGTSGAAQSYQNISFSQFAATLVSGLALFGIFITVFYLLRQKFAKIYAPTTYLVPERQRFLPPPPGWVAWMRPVFMTRRREFIDKCGLDAYFFTRYLVTLIKIFVPLACIILPILLPVNAAGIDEQGASGLDVFSWTNIGDTKTHRFVAHLCMALLVIIWTCYVVYTELKNYIQERQRWMTSPSHRIRASATTVLVTNIPQKWCNVDALDHLFDAFPGGIRNIWINRDYTELQDKKNKRLEITRKLESAETALIRKCKKVDDERREKEEKKLRKRKKTKGEKLQEAADHDKRVAEQAAQDAGTSTGNPNQPQTVDEVLDEAMETASLTSKKSRKPMIPIPLVGQGLESIGRGLGRGFGAIGRGVDTFGHNTAGGVRRGLGRAREDIDRGIHDVDRGLGQANQGGFSPELDGADEEEHAVAPEAGTLGPSHDHLHRGTLSEEQLTPVRSPQPKSKDFLHKGTDRTKTQGSKTSATFLSPTPTHSARPPPRRADTDQKDKKLTGPFKWLRTNTNFPSPQPFHEDDEYPLSQPSPTSPNATPDASPKSDYSSASMAKGARQDEVAESPEETKKQEKKKAKENAKKPPIIDWEAYEAQVLKDIEQGEWKKYIKPEERETMRLSKFPRANWWWKIRPGWWPTFGKKVDVINYCRMQLLVLNDEIEEAEKDLESYPLMNSAFIQFNHQVAAHMACQAVAHHRPKNMGPRILEIDPKDVLWDNMSMQWWNRYLRTTAVVAIALGLIILWVFPMAFVGSLSQINSVADKYSWLKWLENLPEWFKGFLQGVLPPALQALFLLLLPLIFRLLVKFSGVPTGVESELTVQIFYFIFVFIQIFLVVSISSSATTVLSEIANSPLTIPTILANNIPKSSDYFFSYLLLQMLSNTSQSLAQLGGLFGWFVLGRMLDSTPREKFSRMRKINNTNWGTTYPVYTNFGCIVLILSVIAPLILIFGLLMACGFWVVWRYQAFYVMRWQTDSGGLFFPRAIQQLFTGLYCMDLCLIGLFFLVRDKQNRAVCVPHAIVMIVATILTLLYQYMLTEAFSPLFKFVPITMEDEAQERQEAFERAISDRQEQDEAEDAAEDAGENQDPGRTASHASRDSMGAAKQQDIELKNLSASRRRTGIDKPMPTPSSTGAFNSNRRSNRRSHHKHHHHHLSDQTHSSSDPSSDPLDAPKILNAPTTTSHFDPDPEVGAPNKSFLFQNYHDELEDLTPEERDILVRAAFEHSALRMTKPCIWIPRDELGVSDGEIRITGELVGGKNFGGLDGETEDEVRARKGIWITNEYTGLDWKGRVVYRRPPPDFNAAEEFMQL